MFVVVFVYNKKGLKTYFYYTLINRMSNIKMETTELNENEQSNVEQAEQSNVEQAEETPKNADGTPAKKHTIESLTVEIAKYLESNHEHITFQDKVRQLKTVLMLSAKNGDTKTAKIMLKNNVSPNFLDYDGTSPLISAVINHNTEMVKLLLDYDADSNLSDTQNWTPIMIAIANNENNVNNIPQDNTEMIKMLIENRADINQANDSGYTPMIISAMNGEMNIMRLLVENGASVNDKDKEDITVFAHAVMFAGRNSKSEECTLKNEMIDYLVENGADIHHSNINNQSALFLAAHNGYLDMVKYCVEHKMNIHQRDVNGINPMEQAYTRGHKAIASYLANKIAS
jgi:ankyrin repeat protein